MFKKQLGDEKSFKECHELLEREKHWGKKFKAMEDHFQTQEGWWKQKFQQLEALFQGQSTPAAPPPPPDAYATQLEPDVHAT